MKQRDHKAEYARRIEKGASRGLSRSQARGHARATEATIGAPRLTLSNERVQAALRALRQEHTISAAARAAKVSTERLRKYAIENSLIKKQGRRWQSNADLPRRVAIYSRGRAQAFNVKNADAASEAGKFATAVREFLRTNRPVHLDPFVGHGVRDIAGKFHPFETHPDTLYRLSNGGEPTFEHVYKIVF